MGIIPKGRGNCLPYRRNKRSCRFTVLVSLPVLVSYYGVVNESRITIPYNDTGIDNANGTILNYVRAHDLRHSRTILWRGSAKGGIPQGHVSGGHFLGPRSNAEIFNVENHHSGGGSIIFCRSGWRDMVLYPDAQRGRDPDFAPGERRG